MGKKTAQLHFYEYKNDLFAYRPPLEALEKLNCYIAPAYFASVCEKVTKKGAVVIVTLVVWLKYTTLFPSMNVLYLFATIDVPYHLWNLQET